MFGICQRQPFDEKPLTEQVKRVRLHPRETELIFYYEPHECAAPNGPSSKEEWNGLRLYICIYICIYMREREREKERRDG